MDETIPVSASSNPQLNGQGDPISTTIVDNNIDIGSIIGNHTFNGSASTVSASGKSIHKPSTQTHRNGEFSIDDYRRMKVVCIGAGHSGVTAGIRYVLLLPVFPRPFLSPVGTLRVT